MAPRADLEDNLSLLQDRIRRSPESYEEEFLEQLRHFEHTMQLFVVQPTLPPDRLLELINFLSHVAQCYPKATKALGDDLAAFLRQQCNLIHPRLRLGTMKALTLLRNKELFSPLECLRLSFELAKCKDKELRKFLFTSTVQYIRILNTKRKDVKLNSLLRGYILTQLQTHSESSTVTARMALLLLVDLYRRKIWADEKTANAIATGGCLSQSSKLCATGCKFFLGKNVFDEEKSDDEDEDDDQQPMDNRSLKEAMVCFKVAKKTKKREKQMEHAKKVLKKEKTKKRNKSRDWDVSAIRQIYDPQELGERLLRRLEQKSKCERFELRVLLMAVLARLIGVHKLQVLGFYPFLIRYLQPRQRDVTKILLFAAQASHDLVPPDVVESVLKSVAQNFVTDRNSSEAIAVGLNACREILANCPLAIDEDLLGDLVQYKKYPNKNVTMAARSLIQLFREINPTMLEKKERGRPTEAANEMVPVTNFGEKRTVQSVPGAECLLKRSTSEAPNAKDNNRDDDEDEDEVEGQDDEENEGSDDSDSDWEIDSNLDDDFGDSDGKENDDAPDCDKSNDTKNETADSTLTADDSPFPKNALDACTSRIFTDEDFRAIQRYQLKKKMQFFSKKRQAEDSKNEKDAGDAEAADSDSDFTVSEEESEAGDVHGLPRLSAIEHLHKRPKMDREARIAAVRAGQDGREKFGRPKKNGPHVGRTNEELAKRKPFAMVRRKHMKKKKRSFQDKQKSLRDYLTKQKKMH